MSNNDHNLEWSYDGPKVELERLSKMWGRPSVIAPMKGGVAIWNRSDLKYKKLFGSDNCFDETLIRDENVKHLCPAEHTDFVYSSIIVPVQPKYIGALSSVSGSVIYDPLKNILSARCGSIEANIATLKLCTDILLGRVDIEKANKDNLYANMINSTKDPKNVEKLSSELCDNVKELKSRFQLNDGYWRGAFSHEDGECKGPKEENKPYKLKDNQTGGADYYRDYIEMKRKYLNLKNRRF